MLDDSDDGLLVRGFGIAGYRSIRDLQYVGPMKKITVLAGRNNVGKSNILRFLRDHYSQTIEGIRGSPVKAFSWADGAEAPLGVGGERAAFALCRDLLDPVVVTWAAELRHGQRPLPEGAEAQLGGDGAMDFLTALGEATPGVSTVLWRTWERVQRNTQPDTGALQRGLLNAFQEGAELKGFVPYLTGNPAALVEQQLDVSIPAKLQYPPVFVSAFRQILGASETGWDGAGLVPTLAELRDPDLGPETDGKRRRWEEFESFVRVVLEDPDVDVRVPASSERLIVTMNGRELDVKELGTGVHEIIILAAAATAHEQTLFLLEEPEIHLHPLLQRRLLDYLIASTSNQYVIATHSAHFLDFQRAAVFRVQLHDGWTVVSPSGTNTALVATARDLGYRPSDLLQANSVIWVEGPSDRIYLRYWIGCADDSLVEGVDYSIMFYGGKLAAHLSGEDSPFGLGESELIELRRLNRSSAIIMDSDRKSKGTHIRKDTTKGRLRDEFKKDGVAWVSRGREVENYVSADIMLQAIKQLDPDAVRLLDEDDYAQRWRYRRSGSSKHHKADKVKLAKTVVGLSPSLDVLDLKTQISGLISLIRDASET